MANGKFIWCRRCDAVHRVSEFDRDPIYRFVDGEVVETAADDWRDFMAQHAGHRIEALVGTSTEHLPGGASADPMAVAYIEANNGKETVWFRRSRRSIAEPVRYEVFNGRLVEAELSLDIQENEIRKEMQRHHAWPGGRPLADAKIELFIAVLREVVKSLDPHAVRASDYSYTDANLCYGRLDADAVKTLFDRCRSRFSREDWEALRGFVESHSDGADVMAVVKRRRIKIEARSETAA